MLTTTMPEMGAFYKVLPADPGKRPLFTNAANPLHEGTAHATLATLLYFLEAWFALHRSGLWGQARPTKRRMVPVARATNPRPIRVHPVAAPAHGDGIAFVAGPHPHEGLTLAERSYHERGCAEAYPRYPEFMPLDRPAAKASPEPTAPAYALVETPRPASVTIAVTVLAACPRGRSVRGEYQPRTERLPLYAYTCDAATPSGYEANPDAWRVESTFQGSTGYVGGLADALAGPEAELAGIGHEARAAKEAYAEATSHGGGDAEYQARRNRQRDDHGDRDQPEYAGFTQDLDETYLDYREDHDTLKAEYEAVQRTLRRVCTGRIRFEYPDQKEAAIVRHRSRLMALRVEKEALVARWAMIVEEAA